MRRVEKAGALILNMGMRSFLFVRVGDEVFHARYPEWGVGRVIEEWCGNLPGSRSFVKVAFEDGKVRIFDNDFHSASCCYWAGLRKLRKGD